jgi:RhtB (resistance to homoserine/threonine) family protein
MFDQVMIIVGVTVLVMFTPGPDMAIVTRNTLLGGRAGGLQTSLGVLTGNLVHIAYCVLGIGWLISQSIVAFAVLRYAGAAYLVYLGTVSLFARDINGPQPSAGFSRNAGTWYLQGFINNILNPKGTLFYLGVFTMVITPETAAVTTLLLIVIMMLISAGFWLFFVATLDHPAVRSRLDRSQRSVSRIFGVLLISLGLRVALLDR